MTTDRVIVGGGVTGILAACVAAQAGEKVTLAAGGVDPRRPFDRAEDLASASFAGGAPSLRLAPRAFTHLEGKPYLTMAPEFLIPIGQGGRLPLPLEAWSEAERRWLRDRAANAVEPPDLLSRYIALNREGLAGWRELIHCQPALFEGTGLVTTGLDRVFTHHADWNSYRERHLSHVVISTQKGAS